MKNVKICHKFKDKETSLKKKGEYKADTKIYGQSGKTLINDKKKVLKKGARYSKMGVEDINLF